MHLLDPDPTRLRPAIRLIYQINPYHRQHTLTRSGRMTHLVLRTHSGYFSQNIQGHPTGIITSIHTQRSLDLLHTQHCQEEDDDCSLRLVNFLFPDWSGHDTLWQRLQHWTEWYWAYLLDTCCNYLHDDYTNLPLNQEEFLVPILAEDWLIDFSTFG